MSISCIVPFLLVCVLMAAAMTAALFCRRPRGGLTLGAMLLTQAHLLHLQMCSSKLEPIARKALAGGTDGPQKSDHSAQDLDSVEHK